MHLERRRHMGEVADQAKLVLLRALRLVQLRQQQGDVAIDLRALAAAVEHQAPGQRAAHRLVHRLRMQLVGQARAAGAPDRRALLGEFDHRADHQRAAARRHPARRPAGQLLDDVGVQDVAEIAGIGLLHPPQQPPLLQRQLPALARCSSPSRSIRPWAKALPLTVPCRPARRRSACPRPADGTRCRNRPRAAAAPTGGRCTRPPAAAGRPGPHTAPARPSRPPAGGPAGPGC